MKLNTSYQSLKEDINKLSFIIDDSDFDNSDTITINAIANGKVVGFVVIGEEYDAYWKFEDEMSEEEFDRIFPDDSFATIETLEINDEYKGKGYARPLMNKALSLIKERGENIVYLNASPMGFRGLNINDLVKFYASFGFKIIVDDYDENKEMVLYL